MEGSEHNNIFEELSSDGDLNIDRRPVNENTNYLYQSQIQDSTSQSVFASISRGIRPDTESLLSLSEHNYAKASLMWKGVTQAKGVIRSNEPVINMQARMSELSKPGFKSTFSDQAELNYYKHWANELKTNFNNAMNETSMGAGISKEYMLKNAAIDKKYGGMESQEKFEEMRANYNDMVNKYAALGNAMHIPSSMINPIAPDMRQQLESGFQKGGDPAAVLNLIDYHDSNTMPYLATAVKDPIQRQVIETAGNLQGKNLSEFNYRLVQDNQKGNDYSALKIGTEGKSEAFLKNAIISDAGIKNILNYKSRFADGLQTTPAFINSALNYVKGEAMRNNDYSLTNFQKYISDFSKNVSQGYNFATGPAYQINKNLEPNVTDSQWSYLSNMVLDHVYEKLNKDYNFQDDLDRNPLTVVMSPYKQIQVVDRSGKIYFNQPYSERLLDASSRYVSPKSGKNLEVKNKEFIKQTQEQEEGIARLEGHF